MAEPQLAPQLVPEPTSFGYTFGPFRMDATTYQLLRDGDEIVLTSKVFDTLLLLVQQRHRVVPKEELLAAIWPDAEVTDDSLIQCISALRRALGDDATKPKFISTISRRGYRFIAPVSEWSEPIAKGDTSPAVRAVSPVAPAEFPAATAIPPRARVSSVSRPVGLIALAVLLLALGWIGGRLLGARPAAVLPAGPIRFAQSPPEGTRLASGGALSPDGAHLAFAAEDLASGRSRLWVRTLDSAQPHLFEGTDGASRPFWSPDSRTIGFFANGQLKTVPLSGGAPTTLLTVGPRPSGAAWSPSGQIIFSTWLSGFSSISPSGGTPVKVSDLGVGEVAHAWPQFLADGDHYVFSVYGPKGGAFIGQLSTGQRTQILDADAGAVFSPAGFLVFTRKGILTAQRFDQRRLTLSGEPFSVVSGSVMAPTMTNGTMLSATTGGLVAFGGATGESELAWFDRSGQRTGTLATPIELHNPTFSRDERQVFGNTYFPTQAGLWSVDIERGATNRINVDGSLPMPSPDGQRLVFVTRRDKAVGIFSRMLGATEGAASDSLLVNRERLGVTDWTSDGRHLIFQQLNAQKNQDIWMLPLEDNGTPAPLLTSNANEIQGQVSPDGRWLAYASDESGKWEVYVRSFPEGATPQAISPAGGAEPQWRADGRELFYLAEDHSLMAVEVSPGGQLQVGRPKTLFRPQMHGEATTYRSHYAVSRDGQRFLVDVLRDSALDPITVLLNWTTKH